MIFTRRFGALAARPQFPDAPELQQELGNPVDLDAELARLSTDSETHHADGQHADGQHADSQHADSRHADESAA